MITDCMAVWNLIYFNILLYNANDLLQDCVSMSSQEGYMWEDLDCNSGYHSDIPHYTVCMKMND